MLFVAVLSYQIKNVNNATIKNVSLEDISLVGFELVESQDMNLSWKLQPVTPINWSMSHVFSSNPLRCFSLKPCAICHI